MRAVILHRGFRTWGGAEVLALAQARALRDGGAEVHVVSLEPVAASWGESLDGLPVHEVPRRHWSDLAFLLDRKARLAHLSERVGRVLRALRRVCDGFAFVPWDEPFGLVFPEAAAAGMLLVGPDHGGPWEILGGGEFGWCVPPHSPVALAEALCAAWRTGDGEADRLRRRAHEACRARFGPDVVLPAFRAWVGETPFAM